MWQSLPEFGTGVLYAILVAAAYTLAVSLAAGRGRPRLLQAARLGAFGTVSLVGLAVLVLAYAFVSHDFRITYVAHYSDRGMSVPFLIAALWGGQDGSLLWWLFLTSFFTGACVWWLKRQYLELQPYVIATLMSIICFFAVLMIFATNPFTTSIAGAPLEGQGLNYQLRNFYMIIHPPSLYTGFTSSAVPFAFAVAALATGRLDNEWIVASRKWMLFSFLFLSIGNVLGMLWAYDELGWGGPWAWDPVENAAFLPWLTATAFVHSIMIQERRGMMKLWNVILICLTFWLTIFGTFLTRSGLIASVHSFAQSGIGIFFVYFMGVILAVCAALIVYRLPKLRSEGSFDSLLAREAAFLMNNWGFLSMMVFIAVATTWPRISEWLLDQKSTLGPTFYNTWIPMIAFVIFAMMGVAPLLGWRKTSPELFRKSFRWPVAVMAVTGALHVIFGKGLGFPAFIQVDPIYPGTLGAALAAIAGKYPFVTVALAAFNFTVVGQEFARGIAARQKVARQKDARENLLESLVNLVAKSRRRYGGYIVHVGIAVMFLGFAGRGWSLDKEASMAPGDTVQFEDYSIKYLGPRMEVDQEKRMIFADVEVSRHGKVVDTIHPAKFIYKTMGESPSTEVARHIRARDDLYMIIGMVNPQTKVASFQMHVNTLISLIWLGAAILVLGTFISMWPDVSFEEAGAWSYVRAAASVASAVMFALLLAGGSGMAYGAEPVRRAPPRDAPPGSAGGGPDPRSLTRMIRRRTFLRTLLAVPAAAVVAVPAPAFAQSPPADGMAKGSGLKIHNDTERRFFADLLCMCGGCQRESLSECICGNADGYRDEVRAMMAEGLTQEQIKDEWRKRYGPQALAVPPNKGASRLLYVAPLVAIATMAGIVVMVLKGFRQRDREKVAAAGPPVAGKGRDEYDDKLDEELKQLDDE